MQYLKIMLKNNKEYELYASDIFEGKPISDLTLRECAETIFSSEDTNKIIEIHTDFESDTVCFPASFIASVSEKNYSK